MEAMTTLFCSTVLLSFLSLTIVCFGQNPSASCPKLTVYGPDEVPRLGDLIEFRVKVDKSAASLPLVFNWSISSGQIIDGQGTDRIRVKSETIYVTATVDTSSNRLICENAASETINYDPPPCGLAVDEYGKILKNEENARIDDLWYRADRDNYSTFFFYLDVASNEKMETAKSRARLIVARFKYRDKKFDTSRLIFGVRRGEIHLTRPYQIPTGASLPECKDGCVQFNGSELRP